MNTEKQKIVHIMWVAEATLSIRMITPYNILRHELIGLEAEVVKSTHPGYQVEGKIVDETRNTLTINTKAGLKKLPKNCITLELMLPMGAKVKLEGDLLVSRPEDRIKKKYRITF